MTSTWDVSPADGSAPSDFEALAKRSATPFQNIERADAAFGTWQEFTERAAALLEPTAAGKGYSTTGIDGKNALYEFVQEFAGFGHAGGEIVYKVRRYAAKRNPEDLLKIAAWAYLAWRHHRP